MVDNFRTLGGIMNLAPYIDQYLPDLKKLLGEDTARPGRDFIYRDEISNDNGQIYGIPSARVAIAQRNIFIRKDWLDKLGLKVPTNINEFHEVLIAFRDHDPGNVGKNRVIPFFQGSDARWGLADLINNSIPRNISDRDIWINGLERNLNTPGVKDGLRLMNQWYNEKLIYQDFPLVTVAEDGNNILKSGAAGAFGGNWDLPYRTDYNINADLAKNVPGASFIAIDLGLNGKAVMDKTGLWMFIPNFSKSQKDALQYLNWLSKFENLNYLQIGERGRNHNLVDGVPQILATPTDPRWIQNSTQNIDITMPINGVWLSPNDADNAKVLALSYQGTPQATIVQAYQISVKEGRAPIVRPFVATVTQYSQTITDKGDALIAQVIRCPTNQFDAQWDAGLRDWLSSGAQEVINERTASWPAGTR
jgi:putative aldouronate transport system substrate-binding protein